MRLRAPPRLLGEGLALSAGCVAEFRQVKWPLDAAENGYPTLVARNTHHTVVLAQICEFTIERPPANGSVPYSHRLSPEMQTCVL